MNNRRMGRREFLRGASLTGLGLGLAAAGCQPKTVIVREEVPVTQIVKEIVKETVIVEGTPKVVEKEVTKVVEVEKVVKETVVVEKPAAPRQVSLRFLTKWGSGVRRTLMDEFLGEWREMHPEIGIIYEPTPDPDKRIPIILAAGGATDVMHLFEVQMAMWHHICKDLTPYFESDPEIDEDDLVHLPEWVWHPEGKKKGVGFQFNIAGSGINLELFEQARLPMPWEHPDNGTGDKWWDWNDLREAALAINELGDDIWGTEFVNQHAQGYFHWIYSNGGEFVDLENMVGTWNTPEVIEAMSFAIDMVCRDKISLPHEERSAMRASLGVDPFYAGVVGVSHSVTEAGLIAAEAFDKEAPKAVRVAHARSPRTKVARVCLANFCHVIWDGTDYPDAAWEFIKFMSNFDNQLKVAQSGTALPARHSVFEDPRFGADWPPIDKEALLDDLENSAFTPDFRGYEEWKNEMVVLVGEVLRCEKTVEEQVVEVDRMTTELLREHAEE